MLVTTPGELSLVASQNTRLRSESSPSQIVAGLMAIVGYNTSIVSRLAVYGDSHCIDMRPVPHGSGCTLLNDGLLQFLTTGSLPVYNRNSSQNHRTWSHLRTLKVDLREEGNAQVLVQAYEDSLSKSGRENLWEERKARRIEHARYVLTIQLLLCILLLVCFILSYIFQIFEGD